MKRKTLLISILLALLVGCTSTINSPIETATQERTIATTITPTITNTLAPVLTEPPTRSIPTEISSNNFVQLCLQIENKKMPLIEVAKYGTVVVGGGMDESPYLLDLQTLLRYDLPLTQKENRLALFGNDVSPDGESLAYIERVQTAQPINKLWVIDANGQVLAGQSISQNLLFGNYHWLDDKQLQLLFFQSRKDGTVALLDPFTNDWKYLTNQLPNFYDDYELSRSSWLVDYNPNLEWVVYLGNIGDYGLGPIVRDIAANKTIWQMSGTFAGANIPSWSPLGNELAVVVNGQLYRISRDGTAIPLPDLGADSEIAGFSWSPNGQYNRHYRK